jgi:benzoate transport
MAVNTDPREIIARSPMSALQIIAVAITIGLNALDGFDVMSITFASPGIATEWGIDRAALGIVLSMELIGMALGSIFLGGVADKIGRRRTVLGCLVVMLLGMFMVTTTHSLVVLSFWRVLTGLGIGGMLASINAIAAEFSSNKRRHLSVSIMSIGYPVGVVLGGLVVQRLLVSHDWRTIFYFGGIVTATFVPLVYFMVPESVHWLARKQPAGALEKINNALARMKHPTAAALPVISEEVRRRSVGEAFAPAMIATTILCALAYFFHITTFYFIMKWVPKIVADFGFPAASAAGVLVWGNVGGAIGGTVLGLLTLRFGVKGLTIAVLLLSTVAVIIFGRTPHDLAQLSLIVGACGFFTNAGIVGLYAIFAHAFPTHIRAFGTGFAIGFGRGGAVIAPIAAGFLFTAGIELPTVALILSFGSLIGAVVLSFVKLKPEPAEAEDTIGREAVEGSPLTT